jgi:hypothetical protein
MKMRTVVPRTSGKNRTLFPEGPMRRNVILSAVCCAALAWAAPAPADDLSAGAAPGADKVADKPLFRDPVLDGAADPTIIWSPSDRKWYMFYTNRRANVPGLNGVAWVHGTAIGIATSQDGASWRYLRVAHIHFRDAVPDATWWAPAVVEHNGVFHMFVSYVPGTFADGWNHPRDIAHCTSVDLVNWEFQSMLPLSSHKVIDPGVLHLPGGGWRMWYKDEADENSCHYADSADLATWSDGGRVPGLSDAGGEAPLPFHWKGHYWLMRDITEGKHGLAVYRSEDAAAWTRVGTLLQAPGSGSDDMAVGHHPEVIISRGRAYLFYFTHPGSAGGSAVEGNARRSSIQVAELKCPEPGGVLTADRDSPTLINLQPPADLETESKFD